MFEQRLWNAPPQPLAIENDKSIIIYRRPMTLGCCNTELSTFQGQLNCVMVEASNTCVRLHSGRGCTSNAPFYRSNIKAHQKGNSKTDLDCLRHQSFARNGVNLPDDIVTNDVFVTVKICDDLENDMLFQYSMAIQTQQALQRELRQTYTAPSKSQSKLSIFVTLLSISDGSIMGTLVSGTAHLLHEAALGLEWKVYESFCSIEDLKYIPPYAGGTTVLTQKLDTDMLGLASNGKECIVQHLAPIAACDIVSQLDVHCAEF